MTEIRSGGIPVTEAVYQSEGKPPLTKKATFHAGKRCGNCLQEGDGARAAEVLTASFGSWEDVRVSGDGTRWLCRACAWSYRATDYRRAIILVKGGTAPEATPLTWASWVSMLRGPIPGDQCLVVPVGGKRVVLPRAQWGQIATDAGPVRWTSRHAKVLSSGLNLLALGVGKSDLPLAGPPYSVVRATADTADAQRIYTLWRAFDPARNDKVMRPFYLRLLGTERERRDG